MKIRLLIILAAILAATTGVWSQNTKAISYYTIGNNEEGNGSKDSPYAKASLDEALTAINASQEDSVVFHIPDGTYSSSTSSFSITKASVAIIGKDTNSVTITSPFDITLASGGSVSFSGVHLNATTGVGRGVVDIKSSNTTVSFTDSKVTISGAGTGDGGPTVCFGIVSVVGENNNTINFLNSRMFMAKRCQRGIAFRDGNGHTLNFSHSVMEGPAEKSGYDYVIGLCSWPGGTQNIKPVTYNISNSRIDICYYAVFANNQTAVPVEINIDKSDITAWSSLYLRGDGVKSDPYSFPQTIKITDSNLTGRSFMNGPTDGFSTIVFEVCPNIDMTIDSKSTIISKHLDPQQIPAITMDLIQMRNTQGNITFTAEGSGKCKIQALNTAYSPVAFNISDYGKPDTDVNIAGIENTTITNGEGVPYISIFKSDDSFYNAVADITALLTKISIANGDKVVFPEGTFTLPQPFVLDKSLTIEGAGKDKTTIKDHLVIEAESVTVKGLKFECNSTGYLYNEKNAISVFANKVTLTDNEFTQAAGIGESYVTNGIVLYPQGNGQEVSASYNVTGNTFRGITKKAGTATSTPIIIRESFSDKSQLGEKATTATLKDFTTDAAFVAQNSFDNCAGGEYYVRTKGNKYVYASLYSEENNTGITEALKYTDKNTILFISNLKVDALANLITGDLPEFAYIECSDALVVTTKDKVSSLPANNKPVAMLKKNEGKTEFEYITALPTISKLTASGVDAGKTLSTAILKGGEAIVDGKSITGTFAWEHPEAIADTTVKNYNVVFTPSDLTRYGKITMSIPVEVTQYWTVTAGVCNNGKITITNGNAGNRYVDGTVLTLNYIPDAHYKVSADAPKTITVTKDQELTATFEQIMHKVTITPPTGGTLKVLNGDTEVSTGTSIAEGTALTVIATPTTTGGNGNGYKLVGLTAGNNPVSNNAVTVNSPVTIAASFEALPASEFTVGFANDIQNGKLTIMDANNNVVNAGASVKGGTEVKVIAIPDQGYELDENGIKVSGQPITGNVYKVNENTVFSAGFTRKKYEVTKSATKCTIVIKNEDSEVSGETLKQIAYGTVLTATATVTDDDYKLGSIIVNGKEIPNGGEFTVTEDTKVVVTTIEKATINFINLKQTATYDGTGKQFVVQSVPAGLSGFEVSYEGVTSGSLPVNAANNDKKVYKVTITREADETYKAVNITEDVSLTIETAELTGIPAPTYNNNNWTCSAGTCVAEKIEETAFYNVTVTPSDVNYKAAVFNLPQNTEGLTPVSLTNLGLRSMSLRSGEEATLTISATNGGVSLWNGGEKLTETSIVYVGQTLTVKGEPNAGYSTLASWTINGGTPTSDEKATITLGQRNTINVTFQKKEAPTHQPTVETATFTYTGNPIQPVIKLDNSSIVWNILVKKDGVIIEKPTDAATYEVWAQCSEQQQYSAFDGKIGSYTINPQKVSSGIEVTSATPILKGQNIGLSELAGNAPVEGIFRWKNPEQLAEGDTDDATTSKAYEVTFTPASNNYLVESLDLSQAIPFYAATKVETRKVTFAEAANGTFIVKVNGTAVKSGAQITKDDKITVETSPNANYTASVFIKNAAVTTFTVPATGDVTIVVSFTQNSTGGNEGEGEDQPGVIGITGVSLDPASKTLAVNEEFTLQATVTPADADQSVTWSSSDETVATVHNGTVKALKAGKATITASASDNEHYATCEVTVSVSTGIEELLASTRVQGRDGHITIEPVTTVEAFISDMTGRIIYHGRITDKVQIAVSEGLYLVRLSNNEKAVTIKVVVR